MKISKVILWSIPLILSAIFAYCIANFETPVYKVITIIVYAILFAIVLKMLMQIKRRENAEK